MPKAAKPGYYAVRIGRVPGIYSSWADCEAQVKGFAGATYKKLGTEVEAIQFMNAKLGTVRTSGSPVTSPSRATTTVVRQPQPPGTADAVIEDERDCDIVYCDGACKGNGTIGSVAGVGVWWGHGDPRNIAERCPGDQTNNRAELIAIVRILETTPRLKRKLLIKTDSHYSIQCVTTWISKWMSNDFLTADGKPVKNHELIKYLAALLHVRRKTSQTVEFKHVRGHVGIEGNEAADRLANIGATMPTVPERGWEKLENEVLQSLEAANNGLKAYPVASVTNVIPAQEPRRERWGDENDVIHAVIQGTSLPRWNIAAGATSRQNDRISAARSRSDMPVRGSSGPSGIPALGPQSAPANNPAPVMSKEELEQIYASCLLGGDELSMLGRDGAFDSDF